jgi:hypothetical protein
MIQGALYAVIIFAIGFIAGHWKGYQTAYFKEYKKGYDFGIRHQKNLQKTYNKETTND